MANDEYGGGSSASLNDSAVAGSRVVWQKGPIAQLRTVPV